MTRKKILVVVTNHDRFTNGKPTGYWLGEVTHFYHLLYEAGYAIDFASPKGGEPPVDKRSWTLRDPDNRRFVEDPALWAQFMDTCPADQVQPEAYQAIYYAGGHGAMWDLPESASLNRAAEAIYQQGGWVTAVCHGSAGLLNLKTTEGTPLIAGKHVSGFSNWEERLIGLTSAVPYLLKDQLKARGGVYVEGFPYVPFAVSDGRIISGQNPFSAKAVAHRLIAALSGQ